MEKFNVLNWDFNSDSLVQYDVLPYLREKCKKADSYEELKESIEKASMYQFWGRCQYEMIVHGWPVMKKEHKLDVHEQIMMNIEIITKILWEELKNEKK